MKLSLVPVVTFLACCGGAAAPAPRVTPAAPVVAPAPPAPHAGVVLGLLGAWVGRAETPFGTIPFAIEFVREPDGTVHGRAAQGPTAYLDFRFEHRGDGRWLLHEQTAFPGLGQRGSTLTPAAGEGARWVSEEPSYLVVAIDLDDDALTLVAQVRGEEHARFELTRRAALSSR